MSLRFNDRFLQTIQLLERKWVPLIVYYLETYGAARFGQIKHAIPGISDRMLAQRLKELQIDGYVIRTHIWQSSTSAVDGFILSKKGAEFAELVSLIDNWSQHILYSESEVNEDG